MLQEQLPGFQCFNVFSSTLIFIGKSSLILGSMKESVFVALYAVFDRGILKMF